MTDNEALNSRLENLTQRLEDSITQIEEEIENNRETDPKPKRKLGDVVRFMATSFIAVTTVLVALQTAPAITAAEGVGVQIFVFIVFGYIAVDFSTTAARAFTNVIKNHPDDAGRTPKRLPIKLNEGEYR